MKKSYSVSFGNVLHHVIHCYFRSVAFSVISPPAKVKCNIWIKSFSNNSLSSRLFFGSSISVCKSAAKRFGAISVTSFHVVWIVMSIG